MGLRGKLFTVSTIAAVSTSVLLAPQSQAQVDPPTEPETSSLVCPLAIGSSIPLGLAALGGELEVPVVGSVQAQIDSVVKNANTSLQQGLGVHNEQSAALAEQVSRDLGGVVQQVGPVVGVIAAGALIVGACGSSLGSSTLS